MLRPEERIELEDGLRALVKLRASQINGCGFCIDMHWADARGNGEPEHRLAQLDAWPESPFFDDRERAALALTDAVAHMSSTRVPAGVWSVAERRFGPDELAHLLFTIAAINLWNRLAVSTRVLPASYERSR